MAAPLHAVMVEHVRTLEDARNPRMRQHTLLAILVMAVCPPFTVSPETLVRACKVYRERHIRIDQLYHRKAGVFPGRELYFFDPSGNRLKLRDPTWQAGMPEPTFEELAQA